MCRYGKQPLSEVMDMPISDALEFTRALGNLIQEENGKPGED